jgi:hypothetical protein
MDEEIKLKKPGKGRTAVQFHRNSILNSGTKLANQAAVIVPKTNIVGRSYLTNDYLTQAKTPKIPKSLFLAASLIVAPNTMADGTIQPGVIKKQKKLDRDKAKRRPSK